MSRTVRQATPADAAAIARIYAPFCTSTSITFETEAVSPEAMAHRMLMLGDKYPWLVMDLDGDVAGYAYAAPHHERAAFRWAANVSVYISDPHRRSGIGRELYESLLCVLRLQGFIHAIAGVTLPNEPSVGLHQTLGFKLIGQYPQIGYKLGAWRDVGWWQKPLVDPLPNTPSEPRLMSDVVRDTRFAAILSAAP